MKYLFSTSIYLLGSVTLGVFCYVALDDVAFQAALAIATLGWTGIYLYLDKLVLIYLNSREVIDTDEQELFQKIKNEVYKSSEEVPKVYVYQGEGKKCFVIESRKSWGMIIEKSLLRTLNSDQLESLVAFLFLFKKKGNPLVQTKVMGLTSLTYSCIYAGVRNSFRILAAITFLSTVALISKVLNGYHSYPVLIIHLLLFWAILWRLRLSQTFRIEEGSSTFRVLSLFLISLLRPVFLSLEYFAKKKYQLSSDFALEAVVNNTSKKQDHFDQFLIDHLKKGISLKALIMDHIESFPVLENCSFEKTRY